MTEPKISDAEVDAFLVAVDMHPETESSWHPAIRRALAAFLAARVPAEQDGVHWSPRVNDAVAGFNACREAVLRGK